MLIAAGAPHRLSARRLPRLGALRAQRATARRWPRRSRRWTSAASSASACTPARTSSRSSPRRATRTRLAIAEVVADMPHVFGLGQYGGHRVHISDVDFVIESDRGVFVLPEIAGHRCRPRHRRASSSRWCRKARRCSSASARIPNIVAQLLAGRRQGRLRHPHRDVRRRHHAPARGRQGEQPQGHLRRLLDRHLRRWQRELYRWMHRNPEVRMLPVMQVNDPAIIRQQPPHGEHQRRHRRRPQRPGDGRHRRAAPVLGRRRARAVRHRRARQRGGQEHHLPALDRDGRRPARVDHRRHAARRARRSPRRATTSSTSSPSTASPTSAC